MRRIATIAATIGFFVLALVGCLSGGSVFNCAVRAVCGAAAIYVAVTVAWRIVVSVLVDAMVARYNRRPPSAAKK